MDAVGEKRRFRAKKLSSKTDTGINLISNRPRTRLSERPDATRSNENRTDGIDSYHRASPHATHDLSMPQFSMHLGEMLWVVVSSAKILPFDFVHDPRDALQGGSSHFVTALLCGVLVSVFGDFRVGTKLDESIRAFWCGSRPLSGQRSSWTVTQRLLVLCSLEGLFRTYSRAHPYFAVTL